MTSDIPKTLRALAILSCALIIHENASGASIPKADNTDNLSLGSSWVNGVPPTSADVAVWDNTVTSANTVDLGASTSWAGIQIIDPAGAVTITNVNTTLSIGAAGVDTSAGFQTLTLSCPISIATNNANNPWNVGANVTLGGALNGTNVIEKTGAGTLILATATVGTNMSIQVDTGIVQANSSSTLLISLNGGTFNVNAADSNPINVLAAGGFEQNVGGNRTWSGALSGSGPLDVNASSTHTWNGPATNYTGTLTEHGTGALRLSSVNSASASTAYVVNGTMNGNVSAGIFNLGSLAGSGTLGNGASTAPTWSIGALNANSDFSGIINAGTVLKIGTGTLNLDGANTYTGSTIVSNGVLQIGNGGASGSLASPVVFLTNTTSILSFNRGDTALDFTNLITGVGSVQQDGFGTTLLSGPAGGAGANNYTGGTIVNNGTLAFTPGSLGTGGIFITNNIGTLQWAPGNTVDISSQTIAIGSAGAIFDVNGNTVTLANPVGSGSIGSLTAKSSTGNGVLNLQSANTYSGGTTISSGTLAVNNSSGSATGPGLVSVFQGATLSGGGIISGSVDMLGILVPGNGVGTLTVGSLTLEVGSTNNFEFNATPANDTVVVTTANGFIANGGAFNLYNAGSTTAWTTAGTYNLIQFSGTGPTLDTTWTTSSATNPHIANPQIGYQYAFSISGGFLKITITQASTSVIGTWNVDANGNWSDATKWSSNPNVPHSAGDAATFGTGTALRTVTLDANETVGAITMNNDNSFVITDSGKTLTLNNSGTGASMTVSAGTANAIQTPVALSDNTIVTVAANKSLSVSGVVGNSSAAKTLTVGGAGTLALLGNNNYGPAAGSGFGTILGSGATLQVGNNNALGAGDVSVSTSGTLQAGGVGLNIANNIDLTSGATATVDANGNNLTLGGVISDVGKLTKVGNGILTLSGNNTYSGDTTVSGGVLSLSSDQNVGSTVNIILNGGGLLGNSSFGLSGGRNIGIGPAAGAIGTNALIDAASGQVFEVDSVIGSAGNTGTNGLIVNSGAGDDGTLSLAGANTFNGDTVISNGTVLAANTLALQNSTLVYNSGTLAFGVLATTTLGGLTGTNSLVLTNQSGGFLALTIGNNNASTVYGGSLSDAALGGSIVKVGTGTLSLTGSNLYNGTTSVRNGTLEINGGSLTTSNTLVIGQSAFATAHLTNNGLITVTGTTLGTGGSGSSPGALVVDSGTGIFGNVTIGGTINGGSITINGGTNSFGTVNDRRDASSSGATLTSGVIINGGLTTISNLQLSTGNSGADLTVSNGTLIVGDPSATNNFVVGAGSNTGRGGFVTVRGGTLTYLGLDGMLLNNTNTCQGTAEFDGGISTFAGITMNNPSNLTGGHSTLGINGGTVYLDAVGLVANAQDGGATAVITLTSGTLGASADWSSAAPMTLAGNFTFQAADTNTVAHNITLSGVLSGAGGLTKIGNGTLILSGANTYSNNTVVSAGTLDLALPSLPANGTVSVASGATLQMDFAGANIVAGLVLNGVSKPPGVYNHGTDPAFLTGTGSLQVVGTAPKPSPYITHIGLNGTTLTISGTNGAFGGQYVLLQSTNVALPVSQWTPVLTNIFDGSGNFNLSTNIVNPNDPREFYILLQ